MVKLEVIAMSVEDAVAAERGGADQLELIADLAVGGVTPSVDVVRGVKAAVDIPVYVIVRPRGGDFVYSEAEVETMVRQAAEVAEAGADAIVVGALLANGGVDYATVTRVAEAGGLPVTFHKAFDELPPAAMPDVLDRLAEIAGMQRILTSGGHPDVWAGRHVLAQLAAHEASRGQRVSGAEGGIEGNIGGVSEGDYGGDSEGDYGGHPDSDSVRPHRLAIMPGGGVTLDNAAQLVAETGVPEIHVGTAVRHPSTPAGVVDEGLVRELRRRLDLK